MIIESRHGFGNQTTHGRVPPAVHQVDTGRLSQVKGDTASFQTDEKYGDIDVGHCNRQLKFADAPRPEPY